MSLTVKWKFSPLVTLTLSEAACLTVGQLKERLSPLCGLPIEGQRLIHNGRVLTGDSESLGDHLPSDKDCTVHLVGKPLPETPPAQAVPIPAAPQMPPFMSALGLDAASMPENIGQYGSYLKGVLENPMMCELIGDTVTNSPMMRQMLGPVADQVKQVLNDPQQRKWALDMACNPNLAREQMRINDMSLDRALASDPAAYGALLNLTRQQEDPPIPFPFPIPRCSEEDESPRLARTMVICMTAEEADFWQRAGSQHDFRIDMLLDRLRERFGSDPEAMVRWFQDQFPAPESKPLPPD